MYDQQQRTSLLMVEEVEKRPILYNYHLPGYSKKHETEKAWEEVGNVVNFTASECKERWKNIRAVFVRHMKPLKSGCTKDKRAYYLFNAMQFCVPFIKALKPGNQLQQSQLKDEEGLEEGDESICQWDDDPQPNSPSYSSTPTPTTTAAMPQHWEHQSDPITHHIPKKKRAYNDVDKPSIEYWDRKKATSSAEDETLASESRAESLKMFLLSMLPDLIKMDDREVRQFKRKALDAVDDILSAKPPCHPSSCPSTSNSSFPNEISPPSTCGFGDYSSHELPQTSYSLADYCSTAFRPDT